MPCFHPILHNSKPLQTTPPEQLLTTEQMAAATPGHDEGIAGATLHAARRAAGESRKHAAVRFT